MNAVLGPLLRRLRAARPSWLGVFLSCVAVLIGLPSLAFPFGPDQALYFYVGREWLHGSIPYRDVFDHKTPAIYVVHAISILLLGEHTSSIRVADLVCVLALGAIIARLATPKTAPVPRGFFGLGCALSSILHYGFFNFWDTAQTEVWYTTLGLAAIAAARQVPSRRNAALAAGLLSGLALLMKPPSAWYVAVAFVVLLLPLHEKGARFRIAPYVRASVQFGAAAGAVIGLTLAYFAWHHALAPMIDIVVGANRYYIEHERGVTTMRGALSRFNDAWEIFFPLSPLIVLIAIAGPVAIYKGRGEGLGRQYLLALALFIAGVGALSMQQKFFWLHWFTTMGGVAFLLMLAANHLHLLLRQRVAAEVVALGCAVFIGFAYSCSHACRYTFQEPTQAVYALWTGAISREEFAKKFVFEEFQFRELDFEATSAYIRERSRPGDTLCARGFNPEVYVLTGLHYEGRFFWTNFLMDSRRAYRREAFLREDHEAFERSRPRFVVMSSWQRGAGNLDAADYYFPLGYKLVREFGTLWVLEREPVPAS